VNVNAWPGVIPIIPNGGNVRSYVLVMGVLFAVAMILILKSGPASSEGRLRE
jgi:hypothetical protein